MTSIHAVLDSSAIATPVAPASANGSAPQGASFEASLTQALSATTQQTQLPAQLAVPIAPAPEPSLAIQPTTDSSTDELTLPSEAVAAFLAVFLAMAGQALQNTENVEAEVQTEAAMAIDGEAASANDLRAMLDAIQQSEAASNAVAGQIEVSTDGAEEIEALFASLTQEAADRAEARSSQSNAADKLFTLIDRLTESASTSTSTLDLAPVFEDAVQQLDELAAKAVDLGEALEQVAATAAGIARELSAANGSMVQGAQLPTEASLQGVTGAAQVRMSDAVEAAKALVQVAELGNGLHLGQLKGKSEISVQLNPGSLGKLHIVLEKTSDGVTAKIEASTAAGRQAVEANMSEIQAALNAAGINVESVEVSGPSPTQSAKSEGTEQPKIETKPVNGEVEVVETSRTNTTSTTTEVTGSPDNETTSTAPTSTSTTAPVSNTSRTEVASAPAQTATPEALRLASDIADQVSLLTGQGKSEFNLQLRPESLGRLQLRLTLDDGSVTVRMRAESPEAKGMIESNLGQLKQSFSDQGIRVDRFVVEVAQGQFSQPDNQHPRRSRGLADEARAKASNDGDDFAATLEAAGAARPVDYRA
jgi:flagellar hook-length control protein FliK